MIRWIRLRFQDSSSIFIRELIKFHDHAIIIIIGVIVLISYIIFFVLLNKNYYKFLSEGTLIEIIWSIVPTFLLVVLVIPSMKVLYLIEDENSPLYRFKIIAHQWYWTYVVPLYKNISFSIKDNFIFNYEYDSIIEMEGIPRLLQSSSDLVFPSNVNSRLIISSTDVIHSFAVPSLGLKVDAIPGRINQLYVNPFLIGKFFGQCSEICGSNHSFIPIRVKVINNENYNIYLKNLTLKIINEN